MGDNKTLNGALDELRRGRSDVASVTAARLTRDQADALLDEVDRLRAALEHIASLPHISASAGRRADFLAKEALRG